MQTEEWERREDIKLLGHVCRLPLDWLEEPLLVSLKEVGCSWLQCLFWQCIFKKNIKSESN